MWCLNSLLYFGLEVVRLHIYFLKIKIVLHSAFAAANHSVCVCVCVCVFCVCTYVREYLRDCICEHKGAS